MYVQGGRPKFLSLGTISDIATEAVTEASICDVTFENMADLPAGCRWNSMFNHTF